MKYASASIIFDAMTDHSSVTANHRFSSLVSLMCSDIVVEMSVSVNKVHSAVGADLFNSKDLHKFILHQSTTGHHYVSSFVSLITLGFNTPFQ
jgi:hypothetical protein